MRTLHVCVGCWAAYLPHEAHELAPRCLVCGSTIVPTNYWVPILTPAEVADQGDQVARECEEALDSLEKGDPK